MGVCSSTLATPHKHKAHAHTHARDWHTPSLHTAPRPVAVPAVPPVVVVPPAVTAAVANLSPPHPLLQRPQQATHKERLPTAAIEKYVPPSPRSERKEAEPAPAPAPASAAEPPTVPSEPSGAVRPLSSVLVGPSRPWLPSAAPIDTHQLRSPAAGVTLPSAPTLSARTPLPVPVWPFATGTTTTGSGTALTSAFSERQTTPPQITPTTQTAAETASALPATSPTTESKTTPSRLPAFSSSRSRSMDVHERKTNELPASKTAGGVTGFSQAANAPSERSMRGREGPTFHGPTDTEKDAMQMRKSPGGGAGGGRGGVDEAGQQQATTTGKNAIPTAASPAGMARGQEFAKRQMAPVVDAPPDVLYPTVVEEPVSEEELPRDAAEMSNVALPAGVAPVKPRGAEGGEEWTVVEKPALLEGAQQRLAELWREQLLPKARVAKDRIVESTQIATQQLNDFMNHPTTHALKDDGVALAKQVGVKYKDSLRCLGGCLKKLKLEQQIPLVAQFVLTVAVPLLFFNFEEARIVLQWSLAQYALTHTLFHFSNMTVSECLALSRMVTFVPMLFVLWMSTGTEGLLFSYPDWIRLVKGSPRNAHLFLLWLRATLMVSFAVVCQDVVSAIRWTATPEEEPQSAEGPTVVLVPQGSRVLDAGTSTSSLKTSSFTPVSRLDKPKPELAAETAAIGHQHEQKEPTTVKAEPQ